MIILPSKYNTTPQPPPTIDIENEWPADNAAFQSFFHITVKEATRPNLTSKGSSANTNVFIKLLTHHSDVFIHQILRQQLKDNNMYMNNQNIDDLKLSPV